MLLQHYVAGEQAAHSFESWLEAADKYESLVEVDASKTDGHPAVYRKINIKGKSKRNVIYATPQFHEAFMAKTMEVEQAQDQLTMFLLSVEYVHKGFMAHHYDEIVEYDRRVREAEERAHAAALASMGLQPSKYRGKKREHYVGNYTDTKRKKPLKSLNLFKYWSNLLQMVTEKISMQIDVVQWALGSFVPTAAELEFIHKARKDPWVLPIRVKALHMMPAYIWDKVSSGQWYEGMRPADYPLQRVAGDQVKRMVWNYWAQVAMLWWSDFQMMITRLSQKGYWGQITLQAATRAPKGSDPLLDIFYQTKLRYAKNPAPIPQAKNQPFQTKETLRLAKLGNCVRACHPFTLEVLKHKVRDEVYVPRTGAFAQMGFEMTSTRLKAAPSDLGQWQISMEPQLVAPQEISLYMAPGLDTSDLYEDFDACGIDPPVVVKLPNGVVGMVPRHCAGAIRAIYDLKLGSYDTHNGILNVNLAPKGLSGGAKKPRSLSKPKKKGPVKKVTVVKPRKKTIKQTHPKKKVISPKPRKNKGKPKKAVTKQNREHAALSLVPATSAFSSQRQEFLWGNLTIGGTQTPGTVLATYDINLISVLSGLSAMGQTDDIPFVAMCRTATMYEPISVRFDFVPTVGNVTAGRIAALWMPPGRRLSTSEEAVNQVEMYMRQKSLNPYVTLWDWTIGSVQRARKHSFSVPLPGGVRPLFLTAELAPMQSIGTVYFLLMTPLASANLAPTGPTTTVVHVTGEIGQVWLDYSVKLHNPAPQDSSAIERIRVRGVGSPAVPLVIPGTNKPNDEVLKMAVPVVSANIPVTPDSSSPLLVELADGTFGDMLMTMTSGFATGVLNAMPQVFSSAVGPWGELAGFMINRWGSLGIAALKANTEETALDVTSQGIPSVDAISSSILQDQLLGVRDYLEYNNSFDRYIRSLIGSPAGTPENDWGTFMASIKNQGFYPQAYYGTRGVADPLQGAEVDTDYYVTDQIPPRFAVGTNNPPPTAGDILPVISSVDTRRRPTFQDGVHQIQLAPIYGVFYDGSLIPVSRVPAVNDYGYIWQCAQPTVGVTNNSMESVCCGLGLRPVYCDTSTPWSSTVWQVEYNYKIVKLGLVTREDDESRDFTPVDGTQYTDTLDPQDWSEHISGGGTVVTHSPLPAPAPPPYTFDPISDVQISTSYMRSKWRWTDASMSQRPSVQVDTSLLTSCVYALVPAW